MRRKSPVPLIIGVGVLILIGAALFMFIGKSQEPETPEEVIKQFYDFEKEGDFGNAWELFHPEMKTLFPKSTYIQTKNHVFLGHMGVDEFEVNIGKIERLKKFIFNQDGLTFRNVRKAKVDLIFQSQFGELVISQNCYVALEEGKWRVLWNYNF
ncbi:hypothetical protein CN378_10730 [Bacillus sp. AFS015802]|uniref:hypothetical protein n=1 Tax=Bacillus sp. AFS015802 TaxID=2033486 RepID=UPI000BF79D6A|nr:hypothetical protein [Bacillus sp. AFS015802]PFA67314.1 hypothetical protein CN378_10730 [Bacillus sp. AFS015802]